MDLTPEQIAELQRKAAEADELRQRIEALDGNKSKVLDEKKQLAARLKELEDAEKARKQKELEEQGKLKELLEAARQDAEEARKRAEAIEKEKEELSARQIQQRLGSDFMAAAGAEQAFAPAQLWLLMKGMVEDRDGKTVVLYKGSELSPAEAVKRLRSDPDHAHHFRPAKAGGMGAAPMPGGAGGEVTDNPYLGNNVTAQILLEVEKPDLAAKLKREALAAKSAKAG